MQGITFDNYDEAKQYADRKFMEGYTSTVKKDGANWRVVVGSKRQPDTEAEIAAEAEMKDLIKDDKYIPEEDEDEGEELSEEDEIKLAKSKVELEKSRFELKEQKTKKGREFRDKIENKAAKGIDKAGELGIKGARGAVSMPGMSGSAGGGLKRQAVRATNTGMPRPNIGTGVNFTEPAIMQRPGKPKVTKGYNQTEGFSIKGAKGFDTPKGMKLTVGKAKPKNPLDKDKIKDMRFRLF